MHTGMMWFDNSNSELKIKVEKARDYYVKKYGKTPNLCLVHPLTFKDAEVEGMEIRPYRPVLPGHIWIGIEDK